MNMCIWMYPEINQRYWGKIQSEIGSRKWKNLAYSEASLYVVNFNIGGGSCSDQLVVVTTTLHSHIQDIIGCRVVELCIDMAVSLKFLHHWKNMRYIFYEWNGTF